MQSSQSTVDCHALSLQRGETLPAILPHCSRNAQSNSNDDSRGVGVSAQAVKRAAHRSPCCVAWPLTSDALLEDRHQADDIEFTAQIQQEALLYASHMRLVGMRGTTGVTRRRNHSGA